MVHPYLRQKSNLAECRECEDKGDLGGLTDGVNGILFSGLLVCGLIWAIRRL